jgi:xylulokinase
MHGCVPLDSRGELLLRNVQMWCDKRPAQLVEAFAARPETAEAYRLAGSPPVATWWGFKIRWLQLHQPEIYARTQTFLVPKDYLNYMLTGTLAIDHSEASGAFLMDANSGDWSDELIGLLGLERDKLPAIHASAEVIGRVTPQAARLTDLQAGTPVVAGGGDMLCSLLAAGLTRPGLAVDITGTASLFCAFTPAPIPDQRLMNLHHVMPGWIPFGVIDSGGGALKWFKDAFCRAQQADAQRQGRRVYELLDELAADAPPGAEGLLFFPYLMGERTLGSPYARGGFFGLTPRVSVGMATRAILEGIPFELRRTLEIVESAGQPIEAVYHIGGGSASALWSQIKADIYQKPVKTFVSGEGGLLGAAILAGVGADVYPDPANGAQACLRLDRVFTPNEANRARYDALFALFKDLHDRLQTPYNRLAAIE